MSILDFEGYVDDVEESSDDRSAVIEQLWEKQQKSTFAAWCNSHLRKVNETISAIDEDFRDGLKLFKLIEVISGEILPKPERGKMRVHKITNVSKCLKFIQDKGVHLVSIGPEEIVDGNVKMTLGMIWTIILRFAIQDIQIDDMSAKEGLLLWCQRKTSPYKNVRVNNFHMSFKDGLAFCALIHRHRPELIDYKSLTKENPEYNLELAFDIAEKYLDIPKMLDVQDMVNNVKPDELSVMAYVSSYYHAFSGAHKAETASNRICKVISINRENEELIENYDKSASNLLAWIKDKIEHLQNNTDRKSTTSEEKNNLIDEFRKYRKDEKPPRLEEKCNLESDFNTLQTRLRLSNRPSFAPQDGTYIGDVNRKWKDLEDLEKNYEDWLMSEVQRQEKLDHLLKNFHLRCNTHEAWTHGKVKMLENQDYLGFNVAELRAYQKRHEAFQLDLEGHNSRVERIKEIADELRKLNYDEMDKIDGRLDPIKFNWDLMHQLTQFNKENVTKLHVVLEEIDQLQLEYAKQVAPFYNWIEQSKEDLQDSHMLHHIEEVKTLMEEQKRFNDSMTEAQDQYQRLSDFELKIEQLAKANDLSQIAANPYTIMTQNIILKEWEELNQLMPQRNEFLKQELDRQLENEALRKKFVDAANKLGPWIDERLELISNMWSGSPQMSLEGQKDRLEQLEQELIDSRSLAEDVDRFSQELQRNMIFDTPNSKYSMETLRVSWEQLQSSVRRSKSEIDNQILTRDSKGISKTQMDEFVRCFNHFDKNRSRTLDAKDFRACLMSLGLNLKDEKQRSTTLGRRASMGEADFQRILIQVDPNNTGFVTFDAFIDYMAKETTEQDTMEQVIQSFRTLAQNKEYITADEIRHELPPQHAQYCIEQMAPYCNGSGPVDPSDEQPLDYKLFASALYGQSDL